MLRRIQGDCHHSTPFIQLIKFIFLATCFANRPCYVSQSCRKKFWTVICQAVLVQWKKRKGNKKRRRREQRQRGQRVPKGLLLFWYCSLTNNHCTRHGCVILMRRFSWRSCFIFRKFPAIRFILVKHAATVLKKGLGKIYRFCPTKKHLQIASAFFYNLQALAGCWYSPCSSSH